MIEENSSIFELGIRSEELLRRVAPIPHPAFQIPNYCNAFARTASSGVDVFTKLY